MAATDLHRASLRALEAVEGIVLGQSATCEGVMAGFLAGGHVLIEGVPGIGKTLLARTFGEALGLSFRRVQMTPDLMPSDITGVNVFDPDDRSFRLVPGPVFTEVLMADEINRTPPKTQAALLESMQEGQVTIDGESHLLDELFFVIATQNPVEFEGTYPLAEAQADRFLLRLEMSLPDAQHEVDLYRLALDGPLDGRAAAGVGAMLSRQEAAALRVVSRSVHVGEELLHYLRQLADRVREAEQIELGVSPRGALSLLEVARAGAFLAGRDFVTPDDLRRWISPCWGHRIRLTAESELEGHSVTGVLQAALDAVPVPRHG